MFMHQQITNEKIETYFRNYKTYRRDLYLLQRYFSLRHSKDLNDQFDKKLHKMQSDFNKFTYMTNADFVSLLVILKVKCKFIEKELKGEDNEDVNPKEEGKKDLNSKEDVEKGKKDVNSKQKDKKDLKSLKEQKNAIEIFVQRLQKLFKKRFDDKDLFNRYIFYDLANDNAFDKDRVVNKILNHVDDNMHGNMNSVLDALDINIDDLNAKIEGNYFDEYSSISDIYKDRGNLWNAGVITVCILLSVAFIVFLQYSFLLFRGLNDIGDIIPSLQESRELVENNSFMTICAVSLTFAFCCLVMYFGYSFTSWGLEKSNDIYRDYFDVNVMRDGLLKIIDESVDLVINKSKDSFDINKVSNKVLGRILFDGSDLNVENFNSLSERVELLNILNKWSKSKLDIDQLNNDEIIKSLNSIFNEKEQNVLVVGSSLEKYRLLEILGNKDEYNLKDEEFEEYDNLEYFVKLLEKVNYKKSVDDFINIVFKDFESDNIVKIASDANKNIFLSKMSGDLRNIMDTLLSNNFKDRKWDEKDLDNLFKYSFYSANAFVNFCNDFDDKKRFSVFDIEKNDGGKKIYKRDFNRFDIGEIFSFMKVSEDYYSQLMEKLDINYYLNKLPKEEDNEYIKMSNGKYNEFRENVEFCIKNRYLLQCKIFDNDGNFDMNDKLFKRICKRKQLIGSIDEYFKKHNSLFKSTKPAKGDKDFIIVSLIAKYGDYIFNRESNEINGGSVVTEYIDQLMMSLNAFLELLSSNKVDLEDFLKDRDLETILTFFDTLYDVCGFRYVDGAPHLGDNIDQSKILCIIKESKFNLWREIDKRCDVRAYKRIICDESAAIKTQITKELYEQLEKSLGDAGNQVSAAKK